MEEQNADETGSQPADEPDVAAAAATLPIGQKRVLWLDWKKIGRAAVQILLAAIGFITGVVLLAPPSVSEAHEHGDASRFWSVIGKPSIVAETAPGRVAAGAALAIGSGAVFVDSCASLGPLRDRYLIRESMADTALHSHFPTSRLVPAV
eukprot:SAG31_NODE_2888_length_4948_cov_2.055475_1_plen_150_part_00